MDTRSKRSPVALFVALTRSVREADVAEDVRRRAYDALDRLAYALGTPEFNVKVGELDELAGGEPVLRTALRPFWSELQALGTVSAGRRVACDSA